MAQRAFLHVGTPKSGTTYLQSLWWRHRAALADRGLLLPGAALADHFRAASLVTERDEIVSRLDADHRHTWESLLAETARWPGTVLISHELFSPASPAQADAAMAALAEAADEVHLVVTARDLARQLPSGWQQRVKAGLTETLEEFWATTRDSDPEGTFWQFQDLAALLRRWGAHLPPERRHLVVLPRPGAAPPEALWQRLAQLIGVEVEDLGLEVDHGNESLGVAQVEVMRRMHAALPQEERGLDTNRFATGYFTRHVLAGAERREPVVLPPEIHAWCVERGQRMVDEIQQIGCHVVGRLDELVSAPEPPAGRPPASVTDAEVAAAAVEALAASLLLTRDLRRRTQRHRQQGQRRSRPNA